MSDSAPFACPACVGKALGRTTEEVRSHMRHPLELGHEFFWTADECWSCGVFKNVSDVRVPAPTPPPGPTEDGCFAEVERKVRWLYESTWRG